MTIRPLCFVLMPYGKKQSPEGGPALDFDRVYDVAICPAIVDAGLDPVRADSESSGLMSLPDPEMLYRIAFSEYVVVDLAAGRAALEEYLEKLSHFLPDLAQVKSRSANSVRPDINPLPSHS